MAPSVSLITVATPLFFSAPWVEAGHCTVSPAPSFHTDGDAFFRNFVKLLVVPEPSERCTTAMVVDGRSASGLSALISASSQVVMSAWKMPASTSGLSWISSTPGRLYDTVIGAATVGKYRTSPPLNVGRSSGLMRLSLPANCTTWLARSCLPALDPDFV